MALLMRNCKYRKLSATIRLNVFVHEFKQRSL